ncbi:MAG: beta-ketoacyl synthase N-terminal-like domain-containing protein [Planctomycetaceae bacterium]
MRIAIISTAFHRLRVTSRHSDAASACRPFDKSRDGFVVGEGAGVVVLESRAHARSRGANSIAKIVAGGWLNDPTGMTQIDESGAVVSEVLQRTLTSKGQSPDILSLHGTGTESNDLAEARGVHTAFGATMPECFGIKGAIGHLLGAAGSVEPC